VSQIDPVFFSVYEGSTSHSYSFNLFPFINSLYFTQHCQQIALTSTLYHFRLRCQQILSNRPPRLRNFLLLLQD